MCTNNNQWAKINKFNFLVKVDDGMFYNCAIYYSTKPNLRYAKSNDIS